MIQSRFEPRIGLAGLPHVAGRRFVTANVRPKLPVLAITGAVLVMVLAIALIPVPKPRPDFSRVPPNSGAGPSAAAPQNGARFRETAWSDLVPPDWYPFKLANELRPDLSKLTDSDPRAAVILKRIREVWAYVPLSVARMAPRCSSPAK